MCGIAGELSFDAPVELRTIRGMTDALIHRGPDDEGLAAALQRFIGMFAFALWNTRERSLLLVRDRVGVKPLYYQKTPKRLLFGSELKEGRSCIYVCFA
jgi:asparagine synthase (glutamine-hydrolysing)